MTSSLLYALAALMIYLIPTGNAYSHKHRNRALIAAVNVLFGWTVIGWIVALAWSAGRARDDPEPPSAKTHRKCTSCAEWILPDARVCKHCGATQGSTRGAPPAAIASPSAPIAESEDQSGLPEKWRK